MVRPTPMACTNFFKMLELMDDGDMRIYDKDGELAWRASDESCHA